MHILELRALGLLTLRKISTMEILRGFRYRGIETLLDSTA